MRVLARLNVSKRFGVDWKTMLDEPLNVPTRMENTILAHGACTVEGRYGNGVTRRPQLANSPVPGRVKSAS